MPADPDPYLFTYKGRLYRFKPWTVGQREALEEALYATCGHFDILAATAELDRRASTATSDTPGATDRYQALATGVRAFGRGVVAAVFQERRWGRWRPLRVASLDAEVYGSLQVISAFFLYTAPEGRRQAMVGHIRRNRYDPRAYRLRMAQILGSPPSVVAELDATILDDLAALSREEAREVRKAAEG